MNLLSATSEGSSSLSSFDPSYSGGLFRVGWLDSVGRASGDGGVTDCSDEGVAD